LQAHLKAAHPEAQPKLLKELAKYDLQSFETGIKTHCD
jgi:hypothetical protein